METEKKLSEEESLELIQKMINKAKGSYYDTGIGPILWGVVISICSLTTYAQIHFKFELPFDVWLLTLIAIIPQIFISISEGRKRKVLKYEDNAIMYIWTTFAFSIFLLIHININISQSLNPVITEYDKLKTTNSPQAFSYDTYVPSLFLLLYGIPSILTGAIMQFRAMFYGGFVCWLCCIISVYTPLSTDMLLMAISSIAMWLIPGIILRKKYINKKGCDV